MPISRPPGAPRRAVSLIRSMLSPSTPKSFGESRTWRVSSAARPSRDQLTAGTGVPDSGASALRSAVTLARSAAVSPDPRAYTTTASIRFLVAKWLSATLSALVDSADAGSQVCASLFSTDPILLASDPPTATSSTQTASTSHFDRRPATAAAARRQPVRGGSPGTDSAAVLNRSMRPTVGTAGRDRFSIPDRLAEHAGDVLAGAAERDVEPGPVAVGDGGR